MRTAAAGSSSLVKIRVVMTAAGVVAAYSFPSSCWSNSVDANDSRTIMRPIALTAVQERIGPDDSSPMMVPPPSAAAAAADSASAPHHRQRRQLILGRGKEANIVSRRVPIFPPDVYVTVWEWEKPAAIVETYWQVQQQGLALTSASRYNTNERVLDPFGLVAWPGAVVASQELVEHAHLVRHRRILIVGAGVGVEAHVCAMLGAESVLATDIHPTCLALLKYGAQQAGYGNVIATQPFDLCSVEALPSCDLLIMADVLYNDQLARQVVQRCQEARNNGDGSSRRPQILLADSQRFCELPPPALNANLGGSSAAHTNYQWQSRWLSQFTGSGVAIDQDATYDVRARIMWIGLEDLEEEDEEADFDGFDDWVDDIGLGRL